MLLKQLAHHITQKDPLSPVVYLSLSLSLSLSPLSRSLLFLRAESLWAFFHSVLSLSCFAVGAFAESIRKTLEPAKRIQWDKSSQERVVYLLRDGGGEKRLRRGLVWLRTPLVNV